MLKTLTPILSIILAAAIFFFFARPLFAEIESVQSETNEYREAVEKATEFNNFLQSLITKQNSFSTTKLNRLETLVPEEIDEVRALVDLEALAQRNNMFFGNVEVAKTEEKDTREDDESTKGSASVSRSDFKTIDVTFGTIGTYEQFREFLKELETSLVRMEVMGIDFSTTEGDLNLYKLKIRLYALNSSQN